MDSKDEPESLDSPSPSPKSSSKDAASPKRKLPPFLDHFNARDLKVLARCSTALWVASLLIFIQPALVEFGTATFFACIVTLFLPPSGVVMVFLLGGMTMIIGMALGWAWGVITMKAALAARPAAETQLQLQALAQQANATGTPAQNLIYEGLLLDTRVTVVWFAMLGLFVYLMARLKQKVPKLTLTVVFAWIVSDVFFTIGPLLPSFSGTIPLVLIKPAAAALAINLACSILIFPESTSHLALAEMHKLTTVLTSTVPMTTRYLDNPSVTETDSEVQKLKGGIIGCWMTIQPVLGFLSFDFSFGYWAAHDIELLKEPFKRLLVTSLALLDGQLVQHESRQRAKRHVEEAEGDGESKRPYGRHQIMESLNLLELMRNNDVEKSVNQSFQALSSSSRPLLDACNVALEAISNSIKVHNTSRWFNTLSREELQKQHTMHSNALEELRLHIAKFHTAANEALLESHGHLFDDSGAFSSDDKLSRHRLTGLFVGLTLEDRVGRFAEAVEQVSAQIQAIESERPRRRLWIPSRLGHFVSWVFGSSEVPSVETVPMNALPELDKETKAELANKFKLTSKPARKRGIVPRVILSTSHWFVSDEGIFALRVLIATLAVSVVAVTRQTAGFFYREKGLWALIMAQTGMVLQFADFSYAVVTRILGTVAGGVIGMVGWYIGSGNGPGNPYGLAAVMAVCAVLLMWLRLWAPPQFLPQVMISAATFVLVIGYSYIDTHNPSYGNPGVGYEVFWRRTVLVIVGFAVGFIVALILWPTSQSRFVARSLSQVLHAEANHYAIMLSSWTKLGENERFIPAVESVAINLAQSLGQLSGPIMNLKYEFSSSAFDSKTCARVKAIGEQINRNLAIMFLLGIRLPDNLRERFAKASGLLNHGSIANIMAVFSVAEQALKTGDALPSRLPTPLVQQCLRHGHGADVATLTKDMLKDRDYRAYTIVMSSYLGLLSSMDDLVLVLKGALGESYYIPQDLDI